MYFRLFLLPCFMLLLRTTLLFIELKHLEQWNFWTYNETCLSQLHTSYILEGNAANCPGSQLVAIFQLLLNVVSQLAEVFKLIKIAASFDKWISQCHNILRNGSAKWGLKLMFKHELPRYYSADIFVIVKLFRSDSDIFQEIKKKKNSNQDTSLCKYIQALLL